MVRVAGGRRYAVEHFGSLTFGAQQGIMRAARNRSVCGRVPNRGEQDTARPVFTGQSTAVAGATDLRTILEQTTIAR